MMRAASAVALIVGLVAVLFCFLGLAGESLPYQDPTPLQLAAQAESIRAWQVGLIASVAVSVAGVVGVWRSLRRRTRPERLPRA